MSDRGSTIDRLAEPESRVRGGLCKVICGALATGVCLHFLAAVAAVTLAISMIVIAVAGPAAPWIGGIVIGSLATAGAMCVARNRD